MADEKHGKTLFVRNLPYSTTNEDIEKIFSDVGPVKSCFVVSDKESGKCRGFGYVKFTMLEDAEKALSTVKTVNGRNVHIIYANKKEKKKRFGVPRSKGGEQGDELLGLGDGAATEDSRKRRLLPEKQEKEQEPEDSQAAATTPAGPQVKAKKPKIVKEKPEKGKKQTPNPKTEGKRARLIVRNLAFKCSKEQVSEAFSKHGNVIDVHIPKKGKGSRLGFAFVQMSNKAQAGMAMKAVNGRPLMGRTVAVDWALPKDKFESQLESKSTTEEDMEVDDGTEDGADSEGEGKESDGEDNKDDSGEDDESDEGSEESEDESEEEEDESGDEDDDDDDEEGDSEEEEIDMKPSKNLDRPSDVSEGRTLFIRNLPFSVEEEDVEEFFSQFGDVNYAKLVIDHATGVPKGSAFVQYKSKESADSCLEASDSSGKGDSGLTIGGRDLYVTLAVTRQRAGEIIGKKDEKKEQKDTRNLYLAREGMIRPGTEGAKDVPAADLAKRAKIDSAKRKKLRDQNVFVSSVRLCLHNLPTTVTDKQLRVVCLKAAGDRQARVTECRVMRDLDRVNAQGVGKSRGYAFCAFSEHQHALAALRHLNNNSTVFGDKKRPIVEFSLENRKALEAKEKRLEKSRLRQKQKPKQRDGQENGTAPENSSGAAKKKRRNRKSQDKDAKPLTTRKQQDQVARSLHQGPLGLPSHSGPKQRHKPRPGAQGKGRGEGRNQNRMQPRGGQPPNRRAAEGNRKEERQSMKMMKSGKKRRDVDSFDRLVASYKQKIMASVKL